MLRNKAIYSLVSMTLAIIMVVLPVATPISAVDFVSATKQTKIDPLLREKMAEASADEKIPVAIWYTDVDQTQIDSLTKDRVGFDAESVALDYEMPSLVTMNSAKEGDAQATAELQDYFQRTERQREIEKQRTDEYVMTRREISRDKYNEKSARVIKEAEIPQKSIGFTSQYAPMIIAKLTVAEITEISANSYVEAVYYEEEEEEETVQPRGDEFVPDLTEERLNELIRDIGIIKDVVGYTDLITVLQQGDPSFIPGEGIKIGVVENGGKVSTSDSELIDADITFEGDVYYNQGAPSHMTGVARVIVGKNLGFAKGASICCSRKLYEPIETMIKNGFQILSISASFINDFTYSSTAKWCDHIAAQHGVMFVSSAGNRNKTGENAEVGVPALCYNTIGVGAYYLSGNREDVTENKADDTLFIESSYISDEDNGKPDVIMPFIPTNGATSFATPILTSFIAIMYQLKPSLALCPQAVKAIVLASCHRKVNPSADGEAPELMTQGITERQGAGAPDIWVMASIVTQGTYGIGSLKANASEDVVRFVQPAYGATSMNVSLTWLKNNYFPSSNEEHTDDTELVSGTHINLDLSVHHGNTQTAVNCTNSSTEMAYFNLVSGEKDYEIHIQRQSGAPSGSVKYGYAYSLNNAEVIPITDEGIYYLKNFKTNTYLTLNGSTGDAFMQSFTGANNQIWILKKNINGKYQLRPGYGNVTGTMNAGNAYGIYGYYAGLGNSTLNLTLDKYDTLDSLKDGTAALYYSTNGMNYFLNASGTETLFMYEVLDSVTTSSMWCLEKLNYKVGDVTLDGNINVRDATEIQKWLGDLAELSNVQLYLADVNGDGNVTIHDATALQNML